MLTTQGLGRLDALDKKEEGRALRATIFSNVDGLFIFQVSAEDARYVTHELGSGLEEDDLVELGDYRCYARLAVNRETLPAFSLHVDPPLATDPGEAEDAATRSARCYGRRRPALEDATCARRCCALSSPPAALSRPSPAKSQAARDGRVATIGIPRNQNPQRTSRRS